MRDLLSDTEAARILGKRRTQLYRIVDLFDANPNDAWDLKEGVEALARYIEAQEQPNLLSRVRERLFQAKKKRKQLLVSRRITQEFVEAGGTVELRGALAFVTRKSTVSILQTNYKGLANSWERLRQAGMAEGEEALEIGKDFLESDARQLLLSQRGIAAGHRCEVTGKTSSRQTRIDLAGHHLFDRSSRPDLSDLVDNVLVILPDLHRDFHSWNPGPCCPADFLRFLSTARGDLFDPVNTR